MICFQNHFPSSGKAKNLYYLVLVHLSILSKLFRLADNPEPFVSMPVFSHQIPNLHVTLLPNLLPHPE